MGFPERCFADRSLMWGSRCFHPPVRIARRGPLLQHHHVRAPAGPHLVPEIVPGGPLLARLFHVEADIPGYLWCLARKIECFPVGFPETAIHQRP